MEIPFLGKFGPKCQNYQLKLQFCTQTSSNMQNSMAVFTFSVFDRKYPFWKNLVQNIKIVSSRWNSSLKLIQICRIQWCCSLFLFLCGIPFLGKFGPENQDCHLKLKFGTYTNSNIQNSMVVFTLSIFDQKYPFWANLVQKVKIISLSWNLVPTIIQTCRIQWWYSLFPFLIRNTLFGQIWSQK